VQTKKKPNSIVEESLPTALGCWLIRHNNHQLYRLTWLGWDKQSDSAPSHFARHIQHIIDTYANTGYIDCSDISIHLQVTPFQLKVLEELSTIPCGQTKTYGEIAKRIHSSPRAVGQACRTNPIQLFIPCHRILSQKGIGGYMGKQSHTDFKLLLLNHEAKFHDSSDACD
jgi:methylated-DNA-[protein]-cysteine S-methyltransferase